MPALRCAPALPLRCAAFSLIIILISPSGLEARQTVPAEDWAGGFHGLAMIARHEGLSMVAEWNEASQSADELVLFVTGRRVASVGIQQLIDRGASALVAIDSNNSSLLNRYGLTFSDGDWLARFQDDSWNDYLECPVVRDIEESHPVMKGVRSIATNRPAIVYRASNSRSADFADLARFPALLSKRDFTRNRFRSGRTGLVFAIAGETGTGGKLLAVSDPSVFCNQMISRNDNARFAIQAMEWLAQGRSKVAFVIDGELADLASADEAELRLPPPTREEILEALQNLPADKLLEFANVMATMIEDENLVNDFLAVSEESFSERTLKQILFSALTLVAGFFIWYGFFSRDSMLDSLLEKQGGLEAMSGVPVKLVAGKQRRHAAKMLLTAFLQRIGTGTRSLENGPPPVFGARAADGKVDPGLQKQLSSDMRSVLDRRDSWWTARRLRRLETRVGEWTRLHELGLLVYDEQEADLRKVAKA
jgi:hypothetical protein